jgi:hypothetical protein
VKVCQSTCVEAPAALAWLAFVMLSAYGAAGTAVEVPSACRVQNTRRCTLAPLAGVQVALLSVAPEAAEILAPPSIDPTPEHLYTIHDACCIDDVAPLALVVTVRLSEPVAIFHMTAPVTTVLCASEFAIVHPAETDKSGSSSTEKNTTIPSPGCTPSVLIAVVMP